MVNEVYNLGKTTSFNINLEIDDTSSFGKQINYFRKLKNIRAKDMDKALNIGYSTISSIFKFSILLNKSLALKIAKLSKKSLAPSSVVG